MNKIRLGAIGAGHMGGAVLRAVLDAGLFSTVHISSLNAAELVPFTERGCTTGSSNREMAAASDLILLATRPHQAPEVLDEIAPVMEGKCLLSICAGVTTASLKARLPGSAYVLRAMPNLPIAIGCGATAFAKPVDVPEYFAAAAQAIFTCAGSVELVDEDKISAVTAVNGSGVAYFFRMASVMAEWAAGNGIPYEAALRLTADTMYGASRMMGDKTPDSLASSVAVPGGTTEAAFLAFDAEGLDRALRAGMDACRQRSGQLSI